jgi:hypothetical protein
MPDYSADYVAHSDEELWEQSNRIVFTFIGRLLARTLGYASVELSEIPTIITIISASSRDFGTRLGLYTVGYRDNINALRALLKAREELRDRFVWTKSPNGEISSPIVSSGDNDRILSALNDASFAFSQFVKTWQPLMDAIAGLVWIVFEATAKVHIRCPVSFTELSQIASRSGWDAPATKFKDVLTIGANWYLNHIRVLRNQLVHNERVATLLPAIGSLRTIVEIKKPHFDETSANFDLDSFLNWSYGHFLVFCVGLAKATDSMY